MDVWTPLLIASLGTKVESQYGSAGAYCQNLYWQPNAYERMIEQGCDIDQVAGKINHVKSGRYD